MMYRVILLLCFTEICSSFLLPRSETEIVRREPVRDYSDLHLYPYGSILQRAVRELTQYISKG